jgi:oligopeptide/dipeptide ABC transporter ATP-binding protein
LLKSVPRLDQSKKDRLIPIDGVPPDLVNRPPGCSFAPRCAFKIDKCITDNPPLMPVGEKHESACWVNPTIDAVTMSGAGAPA